MSDYIPKYEDTEPVKYENTLPIEPAKPSGGEAVLRGAAQGATLGWGDEASGMLEWALGKLTRSEAYIGKTPKDLIEEYRVENKAAQEAQPLAYGGGEVVGGLATIGATLAGGAATTAGKIAQSVLTGAISGAGVSKRDTLGEAAEDTLLGAGFSAAVTAGGSAFKPVRQWAVRELEKATAATAKKFGFTAGQISSMGLPRVRQILELLKRGTAKTEQGTIKLEGESLEALKLNAKEASKKVGTVLDDLWGQADNVVTDRIPAQEALDAGLKAARKDAGKFLSDAERSAIEDLKASLTSRLKNSIDAGEQLSPSDFRQLALKIEEEAKVWEVDKLKNPMAKQLKTIANFYRNIGHDLVNQSDNTLGKKLDYTANLWRNINLIERATSKGIGKGTEVTKDVLTEATAPLAKTIRTGTAKVGSILPKSGSPLKEAQALTVPFVGMKGED